MQLRRVSAEQAKQMPEEEQPRREREKHLIRHLGRQASGVIGGGLPNQTPTDSPNKGQHFHAEESLLCRIEISIKLPSILAGDFP
jgi:hypothetical protein